ncbi:MAG TPA: SDR family oxidoreductase [Candidatus Thermoplasmatota archaeon]|nr:SDR family oxidoreductase [Candidatus Thermoplasmatota archaeon]
MTLPLLGKRALVTGAATGIGRATALRLAQAGADLVLHYARSEQEAREVASAIRALGREAPLEQADLSAPGEALALARRVGPVDVLVNNAGTIEGPVDTGETPDWLALHDQQWDRVMNVNLRAPYLLAASLALGMQARGGGTIVNVASVSGLYALTDVPLYSLSKAALLHLTRQQALAWAPLVRVNAVAPGWIATGFGTGQILDAGFQQQVAQTVPLARIGRPEEVAEVVCFLAASAPYTTGAVLTADGGLVAELR